MCPKPQNPTYLIYPEPKPLTLTYGEEDLETASSPATSPIAGPGQCRMVNTEDLRIKVQGVRFEGFRDLGFRDEG